MKKIKVLLLFFCIFIFNYSQAAKAKQEDAEEDTLPMGEVIGDLPDEILSMINEAKIYDKPCGKNYDCKNYSDDLERYLSTQILSRAKTDPYWNRYRVFWVMYHEVASVVTYTYRDGSKRNVYKWSKNSGHAIVAVKDTVKDYTYYIEPQSSEPKDINLDFDGDGSIAFYNNLHHSYVPYAKPLEAGNIIIIQYNSYKDAKQTYGWAGHLH